METMYSTNTKNIERINNFFAQVGYIPQYGEKTEPAASGMGQVVYFRVPGFDALRLEGKLAEEWQNLPAFESK